MKKYIILVLLLTLTACAKKSSSLNLLQNSKSVKVPISWYILPENLDSEVSNFSTLSTNSAIEVDEKETEQQLTGALDRLYDANSKTIEKIGKSEEKSPESPSKPKNWVPWHMEMFSTDLGLTAQGKVGVLTLKGNPFVKVFWRKLPPPPQGKSLTNLTTDEKNYHDNDKPFTLQLNPAASPEAELEKQIEPMVQAAMASGEIDEDVSVVRKNLVKKASEFQKLVLALDSTNGDLQASQWWVSGFRFDFTISASGNPVSIGTVGGEVRLRFEWKRLMRNHEPNSKTSTKNISTKFDSNLKNFIEEMKVALEQMSDQAVVDLGFCASSFRVGIGATAKGDIGIAKATGSILGHINFSRDITKPKARPPQSIAQQPILLIEPETNRKHLEYASANGIPFETNRDQAIYQLDPDRFRSGLEKAIRMGSLFVKRGTTSSSGQWRIYEVKADYDMSVTGDLALLTLGELTSAEIVFKNQNF